MSGFVIALCLLSSTGTVRADEIDFGRDVLPILREHCIDCHGPETAEAKLRLDTEVNALRGGDSGEPAIVPGRSAASYLLKRVTHADPKKRMPPDSPALSDEAVRQLRAWIDDAERWTAAVEEIARTRVEHWSFQPLRRPDVPTGADHPIDAFIDTRLAADNLVRSPRAESRRLVRRAQLVVLGLPPAPERVDRFVADERPDAWERLVDELLADPRYGERMGVGWLDLVHFGETTGFETNRERPNAWPYRDWVIGAFNDDLPFDEFAVAQLAGDAVGRDMATGFLVAGPNDIVKGQDPQLRLMQRQDELADIVNTTSTAFLGLTVGCARCHNHKFDAITQSDYYALQAVFAGVDHAERTLPPSTTARGELARLDREIAETQRSLAKYVRRPSEQRRPPVNAKLNVETFPAVAARHVRFTVRATNQSQPCIDELEIFSGETNVALASTGAKATSSGDFVHPLHELKHVNDGRYGNARSWIAAKTAGWVRIELTETARIDRIVWARDREGRYGDRLATDYVIEASTDGRAWTTLTSSADRRPLGSATPPPVEYDFADLPTDEAERGRRGVDRLQSLQVRRAELSKSSNVYAGTFRQPGPTHRLYRGEPNAPRERVAAAAIRSLSDVRLPFDAPERERRVAIARWIADPENPLTARVIVNRLWQFHFGNGLVDTPSDLGANGSRPTHPELLDWLAVELVDSGWSLKHVHRLILTSDTWQQDSRPRARAAKVDADTRLLWRFPPRRLNAEGIRDGILCVAGTLRHGGGGPGFSGFEIEPENVRHYHPKQEFGPDDWRRMVYMTRVRQERDAVFGVFDCPDFSQVVPIRSRSTTPLQALNLLNSRFVLQQAGFLAERLERETDSPEGRVVRAYELCFGRAPDAEEVAASLGFVAATDWTQFARAMLNANEFVFIP